jgi:putative heme-binding domain-containing protein
VVAAGGPGDSARDAALGLGDGLARGGRRLSDLEPNLSPPAAAWLDRELAGAAVCARDGSLPPDRRVSAVALLGQDRPDRAEAVLPGLLTRDQPPEVQAAAVRALASFDRPEVACFLIGSWNGYTPALRAEVVGFLLGRRAWVGSLLDSVQAGTISALLIPPSRRALLLKDRDPAIRARAKASLGGETPAPRARAIRQYKPMLDRPGDPDRGRVVFDRECLACHKLGDRGHAIGPNLASARQKTAEEILVSILDPNREVSPEFFEYTVALEDGRTVAGIVAAETPSAVTLRGREGVEQTILRRNIVEIASVGTSLMPEGLEKIIMPREMADLITFLLQIQN